MTGRTVRTAFSMAAAAVLAAWAVPAPAAEPAGDGRNLVRNGSFEGSTRYWFGVGTGDLDANGAPVGRFCVRVGKGRLQSGAFPLARGREVTVSFYVRGEKEGTCSVSLAPSQREIAQRNKLIWSRESAVPLPVTAEWKRVSCTLTRDVKPWRSWWPNHNFMVFIGSKAPIWVDGVSVAYGAGEGGYVPRRAVEVVADVPELPGYTDETGNLLPRGATVNVLAGVSNPGKAERKLTIRWQVLDYAGERAFGEARSKSVVLPAGATALHSREVKLTGRGLMLARVSVLDAAGEVIDRSDMPLTVLAYPKAATEPNLAERFGTGVRGPHTAELARRIGFCWTRWYPHVGWSRVQPKGPDAFDWPDEQFEHVAGRGICPVMVLYGEPKWAMADNRLPKDMQWPAGDRRWDDLSIETHFDRYVTAAVRRYAGRSCVWEFMNEPELKKLDALVYTDFARRVSKVVRRADPNAFYMVNSTWAGPTGLYGRFFKAGGAKFIDAFTWHDYSPGSLGDGTKVRRIRGALDAHGGEDVEIWFDEGWTFINSSTDYDALGVMAVDPPASAHQIVRSLADMAAAGQRKAIMFHLGYEGHGKSWWDYVGSGTELWDFAGLPTVGVATWNVLIHHLGLSRAVETVLPQGAAMHVFQDDRNGRGVIVAWSDPADVTVRLPLTGLIVEDVMGNARPPAAEGGVTPLKLAAGRPVYVYAADDRSGAKLAAALRPLHEKAPDGGAGAGVYRLPMTWRGEETGETAGNPYELEGTPLWRLDRIWPDDPMKYGHYRRMPWGKDQWAATKHAHGGQPKASVRRGEANLSARAAWSGQAGEKLPALVFVAPKTGEYAVSGELTARVWYGSGKVTMLVLLRDDAVVAELKRYTLESNKPVDLAGLAVQLEQGQELVFVPRFGRHHVAAGFKFEGLTLRLGGE